MALFDTKTGEGLFTPTKTTGLFATSPQGSDVEAQNQVSLAKLNAAGLPDPTSKKGPGFLARLFGVIQTPSVGVRSLLYNVVNGTEEDVNPFTEMGKSLKGEDTTKTEGANIAEKGLGIKNKWGKMGAGLAIDIATDPLTYLGLGYDAIAKNAAKAAIVEGGAKEFLYNADKMMDAANALQAAGDVDKAQNLMQAAEVIKAANIPEWASKGLATATHADQYDLYHALLKGAAEVLPEAKSGVRWAGIKLGGQGALDSASQVGRELLARVPGANLLDKTITEGPINAVMTKATVKSMAVERSLAGQLQRKLTEVLGGYDDAVLEAADVAQERVLDSGEWLAYGAHKTDIADAETLISKLQTALNDTAKEVPAATAARMQEQIAEATATIDDAQKSIAKLLADAMPKRVDRIRDYMVSAGVAPEVADDFVTKAQPVITDTYDKLSKMKRAGGVNENILIPEAAKAGGPVSFGYTKRAMQTEQAAAPEGLLQAAGLVKPQEAAKTEPIMATELLGFKPGVPEEVTSRVTTIKDMKPNALVTETGVAKQLLPTEVPVTRPVNLNADSEISAAMQDVLDGANQKLVEMGKEPIPYESLTGKASNIRAPKGAGVNPAKREFQTLEDFTAAGHKPNLNLLDNMVQKVRSDFNALAEVDRQNGMASLGTQILQQADEQTGKLLPITSDTIAYQVGGMDKARNMTLVTLERNGVKSHYAVPNEVVKAFDQIDKAFTDDEGVKGMLKAFDQAQTLWKKSATRWNIPVYNSRNAMWNAWLMHANDAFDSGSYVLGHELAAGKNLSTTFKFGSWEGTGQQLLDTAIQYGGKEGEFLKGQIGREAATTAKNAYQAFDKTAATVATYVEDSDRIATFINGLKKGLSPRAAGTRTLDTLYDFSPETSTMFERQFAQRLIPFWKWMSNNTAHMLELLFKKPGEISNFAHLQQTGQAVNPVDLSVQPDYMKGLIGVSLPLKDKQGNNLIWNTNSPVADLKNLAAPFKPNEAISQLTPLLRVPLEIISNKSWYYNRPIAQYSGQLTPVLGAVQQFDKSVQGTPVEEVWSQFKDTFGMAYKTDSAGNEILSGNAYANYAIKDLLPWINNVSKLLSQETRAPQDRMAYFTGLKTIAYDTPAFANQQAYVDQQALSDATRKAKDEGQLPKTTVKKAKFLTAKKPRKKAKPKALVKVKAYKGKTVKLNLKKK